MASIVLNNVVEKTEVFAMTQVVPHLAGKITSVPHTLHGTSQLLIEVISVLLPCSPGGQRFYPRPLPSLSRKGIRPEKVQAFPHRIAVQISYRETDPDYRRL
jgi:hypothetical protein